jgi:hypothetical protein
MKERLCESCDEPINPKRLAAIPTATACVQCIEEGFVPDVFTYKSKFEADSMGNIHVEIIHDEHEWTCIERDREEDGK